MNSEAIKSTQSRTDAKLRYAAVHLEELQTTHIGGNDFDIAHQESFLFQLLGVIDAFLQEINVYYQCGLSLKEVRRVTLKKKLKELGRNCPEFDEIRSLEQSEASWLGIAKEMRDHSTHRHHVPRSYHLGGEHHRKIFLRNPRTGENVEKDLIELFREWYSETEHLIIRLRSSASTVIGSNQD